MTPAEMEAELRNVSATLARLREERDAERKTTRILATTAAIVGVAFALTAILMIAANFRHPNPLAVQLVMTSLPLSLLGSALRGR